MKLKKIILLSLAAVVLLGAIAGAWLYFSQPETSNNTWTYITRPTGKKFASTENGCYFLTNDTILHFYDYKTKVTVPLCSKVACEHEDVDCDAFVYAFPRSPLFFKDKHIYYIELSQNGTLVRRNTTGGDMTIIGHPGKRFSEQQQSVSIGNTVIVGDYLYYSAEATNKESVDTELEETFFVGRIHLSSGNDEILFEETMDKVAESVQLFAAKDGSFLFFWSQGMDTPTTDPNYVKDLEKIPVGLYRWIEETGEITVILEADRKQCENFYFIEGDWAYYNTMYDNEQKIRCDNYKLNIETGEIEFICENTTLTFLGGGYALHKTNAVDGFRLMDLRTKTFLPMDAAAGITGVITNIYDDHFFVLTNSKTIEDSMITTDTTYCMVRHDSLKDGLQEEDLTPVHLYSSSTKPVTEPTDPTDPAGPKDPNEKAHSGLFEDPKWGFYNIDFTPYPQPPEEQMEKNIQFLPETVENPDNLPVLKWVFTMTEMDRTWTEDAVIELNQILADKKMPFRVQFAILMSNNTGSPWSPSDYGIGSPYGNYALLASEEAKELLKDADLIFGYMTPEEMQTLLMPITEYVKGDAEYSLQNSVPHRLDWLTTTVDGDIYGISQKSPDNVAQYYGWSVNKPLMQKAGLTPADFQKNFWEMDEVFEKLYKANGNQPIISASYVDANPAIQVLGGLPDPSLPDIILNPAATVHQLIGAIFAIDDSGDSPKVMNILESIRHIQEAMLRYREAGYIGGDRLYVSYYGVSMTSEPSEYQPLVGDTSVLIPVTAPRFDSFYGKQTFLHQYTGVNGIAATSQHKEEALMLLNLLAEDDAFRKQFLYGKEGRDYEVDDTFSNPIFPIEGEDGSCYSMRSAFCGYAFFDDVRLEDYRTYADTVPSVAYPIAFDYSTYGEELERIAQVLNEVYPVFFNHKEIEHKNKGTGIVVKEPKMDAALYDKVLEKLNEVGASTIITGLQRQLDEWLAANQDWFEQMISRS